MTFRNNESANNVLDTWELAFANGGAIMDEIPVSTRDTHEQLAFQDQRNNVVNNVYNNQSSVKVSTLRFLIEGYTR